MRGKAETGSERVTAAQRWVLALASVASFLVILDMLVVATALTEIQRHLGSSLADLEWTVNAYTLSFAVLLMTAAAIGDRLGRRRVFAAGLALFAVSSSACALAPDTAALIAARAVQGAGAAAVMPMALALLNGAFPPGRRGWAIGIYGSVTGLAAVLGPVLGGAVTQGLGWRWIFWINVPVALGAVPLVLARLPGARGPNGAVDLPGLALVTAVALGLVWGLVRGNDAGWGSPETVGTLAAGTAAATGFAAWQRHTRAPMLPPTAELTLTDLAAAVSAVVRQLARPDRQVVLVGHSMAGVLLNWTGEAVPELISRLVYLSGWMTGPGKSFGEYQRTPEMAATEISPLILANPGEIGAVRIDFGSADPAYRQRVKSAFAADADDDTWDAVAHLLTPDTPVGVFTEPVHFTASRWGTIPRTYISCTADRALPPAAQHRFISEADAFTPGNQTDVRELPTSHSPFLSQPGQLARILVEL